MQNDPARNIDEEEYSENDPTVELLRKGESVYEVVYGAECRSETVEVKEVRA